MLKQAQQCLQTQIPSAPNLASSKSLPRGMVRYCTDGALCPGRSTLLQWPQLGSCGSRERTPPEILQSIRGVLGEDGPEVRRRSSSVHQISISSEPHQSFFLKLEWIEDLGSGFVILLSDGVSAWTGEVSEEDVSHEACELNLERDRYISDLHAALTGAESEQSGVGFSFQLTPVGPGRARLQLAYERVQRDISFRLGVVDLQAVPEPTEAIRELILHGLEERAQLEAKNKLLLQENQKLRREHQHITEQMERYVRGKETLEEDLYSRFVLVLNEKKNKLRAMKERIRELEETAPENHTRSKKGESESKEQMETVAEQCPAEESDYGGSTEEEQEVEPTRHKPKPVTQAMVQSSPMDDSLNDITDVAPCRKRRHRHLEPPQSHVRTTQASFELQQQHRYRGKPMKEAEAGSSKTSKFLEKPSNMAANLDPDDLFDDI
ncbi:hypothetical protein DNTS_030097 [Danionella cerebrum]|uniref:Uncharacterized protein n=1 Tax=Danionella cerebrum TaxID=2873325 RepID=A0A553Q1P8_9TELE|nr:hypothetical protein DNTS_030097 [Danionella translucida]